MKKFVKNDTVLLDLVNKIQAQLTALDRKIDSLMNRPAPETRHAPIPPAHNAHSSPRPNDHKQDRVMFKAVCADCRKECTIPFKPSGDRPVYCQDCFSRRKVMRLSGMKVEERPQNAVQEWTTVKAKKKKVVAVKKASVRKKAAPKKK